jgi:ribosomal protein S18 acetylase RimI-like enzyme
MDVSITEYTFEDKPQLAELTEILQDYLVDIDPLGRLWRSPGSGEVNTEALMKRIKRQHGAVYLAWSEQSAVGFIAGVIEDQTSDDLLSEIPSRSGRILELVIREEYRRCGIGTKLIKQMEDFFKENGCDIVRVEVFVPNTSARAFYKYEQYHDRVIDMVKPL